MLGRSCWMQIDKRAVCLLFLLHVIGFKCMSLSFLLENSELFLKMHCILPVTNHASVCHVSQDSMAGPFQRYCLVFYLGWRCLAFLMLFLAESVFKCLVTLLPKNSSARQGPCLVIIETRLTTFWVPKYCLQGTEAILCVISFNMLLFVLLKLTCREIFNF